MFTKGDLVRVENPSMCFDAYESMAKTMKLNNWKSGKIDLKEGPFKIIVHSFPHPNAIYGNLCAIEGRNGQPYIMSESSVVLYENEFSYQLTLIAKEFKNA